MVIIMIQSQASGWRPVVCEVKNEQLDGEKSSSRIFTKLFASERERKRVLV